VNGDVNNINSLHYFKKILEKRSKTHADDAVLLLSEVNGNNKKRLELVLAFMAFFLGDKRIQEEKNNFLFSAEFIRCLYALDNLIKNTPAVQSDLKRIKKETSKKKGFDISDTERHIALGSAIILRRFEEKKLLNLLKNQLAVQER